MKEIFILWLVLFPNATPIGYFNTLEECKQEKLSIINRSDGIWLKDHRENQLMCVKSFTALLRYRK